MAYARIIVSTLALLLAFSTGSKAQVISPDTDMDSVEVSLLTCEPFDEIYALYGHTGLRIRNMQTGQDLLANWGIFDMQQSFFALKFMFGITDYRMAIEDTREFCFRYRYYGSGIREQVLDLTPQEKRRVVEKVMDNYRPENLYYRYNYFYDNCTTRARDILLGSLEDSTVIPDPLTANSFRTEIHQWNGGHSWARWGNDILLGVKADRPTTRNEQEFLPDSLRMDFDRIRVKRGTGLRPLVSETRWLVPPMYRKAEESLLERLTLGPWLIVWIPLVLWLLMRRRWLWQYNAAVHTASGLVGLILTAMIFSQHPTVSLNLQLLVFSPLSLVLAWQYVRKPHTASPVLLRIWRFMLLLSLLAGMLVQHFAEAVVVLALILLITTETRLKK